MPVIREARAGVAERVNKRQKEYGMQKANLKGLPLGTRLSKQRTIVTLYLGRNTDIDAWLWNTKRKKEKEKKQFACEIWAPVCFNNQMYLYFVWIEIICTEGRKRHGDWEKGKGELRVRTLIYMHEMVWNICIHPTRCNFIIHWPVELVFLEILIQVGRVCHTCRLK